MRVSVNEDRRKAYPDHWINENKNNREKPKTSHFAENNRMSQYEERSMRRISVFLSVLLILAAISNWKKERESLRGHLWREEQICGIVSAIANIKFRNLGLIFYRSRKKETLFFAASNQIRFLFFILACKGDCDFSFFKIDCGVRIYERGLMLE